VIGEAKVRAAASTKLGAGNGQPHGSAGVTVGGVGIHAITEDEVKEWLRSTTTRPHGGTRIVATVNLDHLAIARRDPAFMYSLNQADLALADGVGVLLLSSITGRRLPARVAGSDLTAWLVRGGLPGIRLYLLGSTWDVLQHVRTEAARHGALVVGASSPSRAVLESEAASAELVEHVHCSNADILLVAFGAPRQEKWIVKWRDQLGVSVAMGVGGSLDFIAGRQRRAPLAFQRLGLEWTYRMATQPGRLTRRYLLVDVPYLAREGSREALERLRARRSKGSDRTAGGWSPESIPVYGSYAARDTGGDSR
jgi:N-acetylglucosaminyldiphosphoundecaprenol N-acetyl-beta-D-mannosaminyltransferase